MGVSLNWITDSVVGQLPIASADTPAIAFDDQPPITWGQFREKELLYASALRAAGVGKGDRVAILMHNCPEYAFLLMAIARVGAISVRLNWRLSAAELQFLLNDSGSKVLILDELFVENIDKIHMVVPVETYVVRETEGEKIPNWSISMARFLDTPIADDFPELEMSDPVTIMYTSGTTGLPKGAVLTHGNLLWIAAIQVMTYGVDSSTKTLVSGPMFHAAAWEYQILPTLMVHGTAIHFKSTGFNLDRFLAVGRQHDVTMMFLYTHMLHELLRRDDCEEVVPKNLQRLVAGGDTVMPWVYDEFERRLPGVNITQTYARSPREASSTRFSRTRSPAGTSPASASRIPCAR